MQNLLPFVVVSLAINACSGDRRGRPAATDAAKAEHRDQVRQWRSERDQILRREDGWLTLAGLLWIEPGNSSVGSGAQNDVQFPDGAPEQIGTIHLDPERPVVEFSPAAGVDLEVEGVQPPLDDVIELQSDAEGSPTVVRVGSMLFHVIERDGRYALRIKDSASPVLARFEGLEYFPTDPAWRFRARFEAAEPGRSFTVPNVLGTPTEEPCVGTVVFEHDGETVRIDAMDGGSGKLFLVFGDTTNGRETYGGGRFVVTDPPTDGEVVVDFNKAYSPPCIFTPYATCPLPPPQNRIRFAIESGEKTYAGLTLGH